MAIVEVFGSRTRTKAELDACLMLIERGFVGPSRSGEPTEREVGRDMASRELQKLLESIRAAGSFDGDLMTMRKMMSRAPAYPKPEDITWEPVDAAGVPAEWVIPDDCEPGRALVYLHGGGYATGTLESARGLCSHLARATRARLLAVDYRLAPEHPFPAAVDDAVAAYRFADLGGPRTGGHRALR